MAIVTIQYDGRSSLINKLFEAVVLSGGKIIEMQNGKTNATTRKAIKEAKTGDVLRFKSADDLINCMYEL